MRIPAPYGSTKHAYIDNQGRLQTTTDTIQTNPATGQVTDTGGGQYATGQTLAGSGAATSYAATKNSSGQLVATQVDVNGNPYQNNATPDLSSNPPAAAPPPPPSGEWLILLGVAAAIVILFVLMFLGVLKL